MHRKTSVFSLVLIVCLLLLVGGANAQGDFSDEELEAIDFLAAAFENTVNADSYSAEVEQTITQEITSGTGRTAVEVVNEITQTIALEVEQGDEGPNFSGVVEQSIVSDMGTVSNNIELSLELVNVDGVLYARATDVPAQLASSFPEDWVNVTEDGQRYPFLNTLNVPTPELLYNSVLAMPMDADSLLAVEEVDSEEIDGQNMRVFEVEYDAQAMFESESMAALVAGMSGLFPGVDVADVISQLAEGSTMTFTAWVGEDDELVHRVDSTIEIDADLQVSGMEARMVQSVESSVSFADFGEDFEIEAPDL